MAQPCSQNYITSGGGSRWRNGWKWHPKLQSDKPYATNGMFKLKLELMIILFIKYSLNLQIIFSVNSVVVSAYTKKNCEKTFLKLTVMPSVCLFFPTVKIRKIFNLLLYMTKKSTLLYFAFFFFF